MKKAVRYPVGQQSFEVLRTNELLYVDKTRFIEEILSLGSQYFFLGRPRRFGKSLFLSTLKCFFLGKRELFKGLYIDSTDWKWEKYPVFHIDLNIEKYNTPEAVFQVLENLLFQWESEYGVVRSSDNISVRFSNIIRAACEKTGRRVVILVDEYDKPLVSNLNDKEKFEAFRDALASFYSNFKSSADYIQLVFLTGVSRFGHLSVFSGINNIVDLSLYNSFSAVCGITESELRTSFSRGIAELAEEMDKTEDEILSDIKTWYDGYRFAPRGEEIYNPFSVLNLMQQKDFMNYWIQSGYATLLQEELRRLDIDLNSLLDTSCSKDELVGLDLDNPQPVALFYQTGYLTIKGLNRESGRLQLGLPNKEVTDGFLNYILPLYSSLRIEDSRRLIDDFVRDIRYGKVDAFMERLQTFFASITYELRMDDERNFQNALFIFMKLLGLHTEAEYHTSAGRIDLFVATPRFYYIIELKRDGSAREALGQINRKDYALPFRTDGREIIRIGVNFDSGTRTFSDWLCER